jgi:RNA polymerase sigma factor (sigma-70 family)
MRAMERTIESEPAVQELLQRHGGRLMAVARRYSSCREDAEDAYQRASEILLRRAPSNDPAHLLPWMKTVVKHEAFAVARQRARGGVVSEMDQIEPFTGLAPSSDELAERRDRLRLGAEALGRLKPQEVRALLLRADGLSYREICEATGWSYTKVNRCLSEGRRSFVDRVAGIEGGAECSRLAPVLSSVADGEASAEELAALRPHLDGCLACRARLREYRRAPSRAAAVAVPVGVLRQLLHAAQGFGVGKSAAVVASAVAVAGGGAAVVGKSPEPAAPRERPAARVAPARRRVAPPPAVRSRRSAPARSSPERSTAAMRRESETVAPAPPPPAAPVASPAPRAPRRDAPATRAAAGPPGGPSGGEFSP